MMLAVRGLALNGSMNDELEGEAVKAQLRHYPRTCLEEAQEKS
jgi:hypothetical protein